MNPTIVVLSRTDAYVERLTAALDRVSGTIRPGVLVNNGLRDPARFAALGSTVITPGWNSSFSEGANIALAAIAPTGASHVLFLNDDVIPEPGFVAKLWARRHGFGVLGALLLHSDGTVNHAGVAVHGPACDTTNHLGRHQPRADWEKPGTIITAAATFGAALVETELFHRIGGLDERYIYGWEDPDFCLRALEAGARVGVALDAVAVHDECGTRPRGGARDAQNHHVFVDRWGPGTGRILRTLRGYLLREPTALGVTL